MIYIMSDIHGQLYRYKKMLKDINFSDDDYLYVLGDVIDRGPDGIEILLDLMERDNVEVFLGNHEHMMLTYLCGIDRESWFYENNGGMITYKKFFEYDEKTRNDIISYLYNKTTLVKRLEINNHTYILSHTGFYDKGDLYTKDLSNIDNAFCLVWNMFENNLFDNLLLAEPLIDDKITFISGHKIVKRFHDSLNVFTKDFGNGYIWIDIDCGCAMGAKGQLSCLAISPETGEIENIFYVK